MTVAGGDAVTDRVVVVVVTYDAPERVRRCVDSVRRAGGVERVVVVDNGGRCDLAGEDGVEVVRSAHNGGFGAGANLGFAAASVADPGVVVLLNDDIEVTDGWLAPLLDAFDTDGVGAVQPMLVFAGGERSEVNSLGVEIGGDGAGTDIGLGAPVADAGTAERPIELFTGGAVAFRPRFLRETGGFDERYFLYYEDVDLGRRGARLGWRYTCVPTSVVEHVKGASTDTLGDRTVYLRERNRLWSAFRNERARTVLGAVWLSVRRLRHAPRRVHATAIVVGVAGGVVRLVERIRER